LTTIPTNSVVTDVPNIPASQTPDPVGLEESKAASISWWAIILGVGIAALIAAILLVMLRKRTPESEKK
jgi:hypothetical protein